MGSSKFITPELLYCDSLFLNLFVLIKTHKELHKPLCNRSFSAALKIWFDNASFKLCKSVTISPNERETVIDFLE